MHNVICKRLYCLPDPVYVRALNGEHAGEYSMRASEVRLDADGIFALVSTLELCRAMHAVLRVLWSGRWVSCAPHVVVNAVW